MQSLDDTQPNIPLQSDRPGCAVIGFITLMLGALALLIVTLAGTAGYTAGERITRYHLKATDQALIDEQLIRIPTDIQAGNTYLLVQRLNYLETVSPDILMIPELQMTATHVYVKNLPTQTPPPTASPSPTITPSIRIETTQGTPTLTRAADRYDPVPLLQEAHDQIARGRYEEAYETLDAIIRIDENFQRNEVQGLISDTLNTLATQAYTSTETLPEAIRWTDLAEQYGSIGDLSYERLLATLYLNSQSRREAGDHLGAINSLVSMINYQNTYKGINLNRQLFNAYVASGDAFMTYDKSPCRAVVQYNGALDLFNDQSIEGKRDAAQTDCERGLTATPDIGAEGQTPVAPIGVPGT